jgi:pimeloyl-ACP methyl ester carboxylesterase
MSERIAPANGIEIAYETIGDPDGHPLLLVMGLGVQMLGWDEKFCRLLADRGFYVIRFDNRDVGLSTKIRGGPRPRVWAAVLGDTRSTSYTLDDMADDAAGLLDHLGVDSAHVMGASMGGMIGQTMAIRHPSRVRSLVSIMSSTGDRRVGRARLVVLRFLMRPVPARREKYIKRMVRAFRAIGSPAYPLDEDRIRRLAAASYDRCFHPAGTTRQLVGILASGDRTESLRGVRAPTLVIHGENDPLVNLSGGKATAAAIPGAELMVIPGMGHDMPPALWPTIVDAAVALAERADGRAAEGLRAEAL